VKAIDGRCARASFQLSITDYAQPPDPFYLRHSTEKKMANLATPVLLQGIRHREFVKVWSRRGYET